MFVRAYCKENKLTSNVVCEFLTQKYNQKFTPNNKLLAGQIEELDNRFKRSQLPSSEPQEQAQLPQGSNLPVQAEQNDLDHTGEQINTDNGQTNNHRVSTSAIANMIGDVELGSVQKKLDNNFNALANVLDAHDQRVSELLVGRLKNSLEEYRSIQPVERKPFVDPMTPEFAEQLKLVGVEVPTKSN